MEEKIKKTCLVLITLAILVSAGFYWYQRQEMTRQCILRCEFNWEKPPYELWKYRGFDKYFSTRDECVDWCLASDIPIPASEMFRK